MSPVRLAAALLLFAALGAALRLPVTARVDHAVTVTLQRAAPAPDVPAAALVFLGDAEVTGPLALLAGVVLWARNRERGAAMVAFAVALVCVSLLAVLLKYVIPHPGPPWALQRHLAARPGLYVPEPYSFPSGHTMRTTFIAGMLLRQVPVLAAAILVGMMAALVYLGGHWFVDVLGGLCLGWACVEAARTVGPSGVTAFVRGRWPGLLGTHGAGPRTPPARSRTGA